MTSKSNLLGVACSERTHAADVVGDKRVGRILQIARSFFGRYGFAATTMDEIASAANVSKKTLYKLFENKAALFRAVLEGNLQIFEFSEEVPTSNSALLDLQLAVQKVVTIIIDPDEVALHRLLVAERHQSPSLIEIFSDVIFQKGANGIVAGIQKVRLKPGIDQLPVALVADMLLGAALGKEHFRSLIDGGYEVDRVEMEQRIRAAIDLFCVPDALQDGVSK